MALLGVVFLLPPPRIRVRRSQSNETDSVDDVCVEAFPNKRSIRLRNKPKKTWI